MTKTINFGILLSVLFLSACGNRPQPVQNVEVEKGIERIYNHVDWSKNANIYEVNIRQYSEEGTLKAFEKHMPRLKEMGVDILWLMPIHPISEKNRKGSMGSYYAVQDYQKVNPEFGTIDDLRDLVNSAHEMGMKVIIDWVANHSGWDNWMIDEHPDWYTQDSLGNIVMTVGTDWTDVADLNYDSKDMREYMIQSLEFWVKEANIDGYRCDVAGMVPIDFWMDARKRLDAIKPVFMLAEDESVEIHKAFDMSYGWEFHHIMNGIAKGEKGLDAIDTYMAKIDSTFDSDDYIMNFTSNHDENSWSGTEFERMGDAFEAMAVLSSTVPGMSLIYSGQEDKLNKRLKFFEKDEIEWGEFEMAEFYSKLLNLKMNNQALWNGDFGGDFHRVETTADEYIYAFVREKGEDKVVVLLNLSEKTQVFSFNTRLIDGNYISLFNQTNVVINNESSFDLKAWKYLVLSNN